MLVKSIAAGLAATALLVTAVSAQTPATKNGTPSTISEQSLQGDWRTSKVVGLSVYDDNNSSIGTINDLITDKNGNIKAAVLGVGGLLGVGEHLVAVPFDKLKFVNEPVSSSTASNDPGSRPASSTTTGAANSSNSSSAKSNTWYPDHAVFNATKDELKAMPEFKYSS